MAWFTLDEIKAIAPDSRAVTAAKKIAKTEKWKTLGQHNAQCVWGVALGSKGDPYAVFVTSNSESWGCSCPSRKQPCKHVLALLLLQSEGTTFPDNALPQGHRYSTLEP